jgi:hypothetical protein
MQREPEASPLKNITGGSGCGCGCLGVVIAVAGIMAISGTYIELYEGDGASWAWTGGFAAIVGGMGLSTLGVVLFGGSLFLD